MSDEEIVNEYIIAMVCAAALRDHTVKQLLWYAVISEEFHDEMEQSRIKSEIDACNSKAEAFEKTANDLAENHHRLIFGW